MRMKKLISVMLLLLFTVPCLRAQRKEMSQARSYIKSGKDFDKAEKLMTDLLAKDSASRQNPKVYLLWYQAVQRQYDAGNEKLYLNQKYDTASIFSLTRRMFAILETLDSLDAAPDNHGRSKPEYRRRHAELLNTYRPNLYFGGTYYIRKNDFAKAYDFFDTYLDCAVQPLFAGYRYDEHDRRMPEAAYWATFCGYKTGMPEQTLKYADLARRDSAHLRFALRNITEAYISQKNEAGCVKTLQEGFSKFPESLYFFPRLMDYYTTHNRLDSALAVADQALASDPKSELFLFAKSTVLLNQGKYADCIALTDSLIQLCDTLSEPYFNVATAYLNQALALENGFDAKQNKKRILAFYSKAMPYMEKYRVLAPDEKKKWAPALYKIYLNLNMGKQFDEIDKILNHMTN